MCPRDVLLTKRHLELIYAQLRVRGLVWVGMSFP